LRFRTDPLERRLRKCLALADEMRGTDLRHVRDGQLEELLKVLRRNADASTPPNLMTLPPPGWIGRMLFRQSAALFTRKDNGPNCGPDGRSALDRMSAAYRFARGTGRVPRLHVKMPEATFEDAERPRGPVPMEAEAVLERYYQVKVGSLQFCGAASFGLPFWEGFEALALTFPLALWVARTMADRPRDEAIATALTIVDDHIGFNRVLGSATAAERAYPGAEGRTGQVDRLVQSIGLGPGAGLESNDASGQV